MKKIILAFILACFCSSSPAANTGDGYKTVEAVAISVDTFRLSDGSEIKIYNDTLQVNESYVLLVDTINDFEVLDYNDIETVELNNGF